MLVSMGAEVVRRWAVTALTALGQERERIDALNVFPVADRDTGTNVYLTLEAGVSAASAAADQGSLLTAFARGALLGARGSSGAITAQLLSGWASGLGDAAGVGDVAGVAGVDGVDGPALAVVDGPALAGMLEHGDRLAWTAVGEPVQGTMLTVSRAAATAARHAARPPTADRPGAGLAEVVTAAVAAARSALAATTAQLPVLARAGVVDAGGAALLVLLEAMEDVVLGRRARVPRAPRTGPRAAPAALAPAAGRRYEVMYLLEVDEQAATALRAELGRIGQDVVVVGGAGLWQVHAHGQDAGALVEAGLRAGRPAQLRVSVLETDHRAGPAAESGAPTDQQTEQQADQGADCERSGPAHSGPARPTTSRAGGPKVGLVACAGGEGLAEVLRGAGVVVVPASEAGPPSAADLLAAIRSVAAEAVAVLPNEPHTIPVAQAVAALARQEGLRVGVLPTRSPVQALAAVAVHDPAQGIEEAMVRLSAAAAAVRYGAVTVARQDAATSAGVCRAGDVLGLVTQDVVTIGTDLGAVAVEVLRRLMAGGAELVSVVVGDQRGEAALEHLRLALREHRDVELVVLRGGPARYPLLLGVE